MGKVFPNREDPTSKFTRCHVINCSLHAQPVSLKVPSLLQYCFNVHINDLEDSIPDHLTINTNKYADDCTLDEVIERGLSSHVQESTNAIINRATENKMMINAKKAKDMWICFAQSSSEPPPVRVGDTELERVKTFKLLGVWVQNDLK